VRLWADWPTLQPDPAIAIDHPANPGAPWLQALDEQITVACRAGLSVVLVLYRFPLWANGMQALAAQRGTDAEVSFAFADRITPAAWARYVREGRDPAIYDPNRRGLEFRIPPDGLGAGTAWARFLEFLYKRYHYGQRRSGRFVRAFELTNEPTHQWWPKFGPSATADPFALGDLTLPGAFAQAMQTAQAVGRRYGNSTRIFAPSISDAVGTTRNVVSYTDFVPRLLDELDAIGFRATSQMTWSHHNYIDLETRTATTVTQAIRAMLRGRWRGAQSGGGASIWITEGGVRLANVRRYFPAEDPLQGQLLSWQVGWDRHARNDGPGAGVEMLAQYTLHADPRFDSGLLEPWPSEVHRPAYDFWMTLPRYA
jgi:hypothetical protein